MTYTKGKWTINPSPSESSSGWTAIERNDEVIAEVYGSDEESQTLASLIASAPELLTACKYALDVLWSIPEAYAEQIADILDESIDTGMIEDAIAKAEGGRK